MNDTSPSSAHDVDRGPMFAMLLLRLWLAVRAIQTGIEKYAGTKITQKPLLDEFGEPDISGAMVEAKSKVYGLAHYHGIPEPLVGPFKEEPLIPGFFLKFYDMALGPALLLVGVTLLLGIATRVSLFVMGLIYISLTWGLILLKQDGGVAWLAAHMVLIAMALMLAKHNPFQVPKKW